MPTEKQIQEILRELAKLSSSVDSLKDSTEHFRNGVDERFDSIDAKVDACNHLLTGNGTPEKGVIVRLDRLEQSRERTQWFSRAAMVAAIGATVSSVANWLKS